MPLSSVPRQRSRPRAWWSHPWLAWLCQMELAIVLLGVLALCSLLGTVMPQANVMADAEIQRRFGDWYFLLRALGLFSVFTANWFIALEALFFVVLAVGSLRWLHPAWKSLTQKTFLTPAHIRQYTSLCPPLPLPDTTHPDSFLQQVTQDLQQKGYRVFAAPNGSPSYYAHKGNIGRASSIVTHIGLLLLMAAGVYGAFTNFTGQALMAPYQPIHLTQAQLFQTSVPAPWWQGKVPDWRAQVTRFEIDYYSDHPTVARQYRTQLQILPAQPGATRPLTQAQVSVNHPFTYDGVTFYQASFAPTGQLLVQVNGRLHRLQATQRMAGRPYARLPLTGGRALLCFPFFRQQDGVPVDHLQVFYQQGGRIEGLSPTLQSGPVPPAKRVSLYAAAGQPAQSFHGAVVAYQGPEMASGLQIKSAPEVPWMYLAFLLVSVGVGLSLIPQRQLWLALEPAQADQPATLWLYWKTRKSARRYGEMIQTLRDQWHVRAHAPPSSG